jgi:hypothetical protein
MQQRQLRLGDILDDYCPRERRVTNHAVVAMVGPAVKQTRCSTCDAEHEYKGAKVPPRRKKEAPGLYSQVLAGVTKGTSGPPDGLPPEPATAAPPVALPAGPPDGPGAAPAELVEAASARVGRLLAAEPDPVPVSAVAEPEAALAQSAREVEEDGPVHRQLIRATLPRTEATAPVRQIPEFTIRQNGSRAGKFRGNAPNRQRSGGDPFGSGMRHVGRSGGQGGRGNSSGSASPHQRSAQQPHGGRVSRPGKKRSR